MLGKLFWADLERHHPGIGSLRVPADVAAAWKKRLRTVTKTVRGPGGKPTEVSVQRVNYRECLTPVRALHLDLAHWAVEEPARWGPWVVPCPVGSEEISRRKDKRRRKSRMDARTRERLQVLPVLARTVAQRRAQAAGLLEAARQAKPGQQFTAPRQTLIRSVVPAASPGKVWGHDPAVGKRRDLSKEEEHAFWAFAAVEVLRATGIRIENSPNCPTTAWRNTSCPAPARSSRCCRSPPRKPTRKDFCWSRPSSGRSSPRSSAGSAAGTGRSRSSPPTTSGNGSGCRRRRCCSSGASERSTGRSARRPSAPSSPRRSPIPA